MVVGGLRPDIDVDDNASTQRAKRKKRAAADATEHVLERVPEHVLVLEDEKYDGEEQFMSEDEQVPWDPSFDLEAELVRCLEGEAELDLEAEPVQPAAASSSSSRPCQQHPCERR